MSEKITVKVKTTSGEQYSLEISPAEEIKNVKKLLVPQCQIPENQQRLIYSGHILQNEKTVLDYGIKDGFSLHLVKGKSVATTDSSSNASSSTTLTPSGMQSSSASSPTLNNSMPGPGGASSLLNSLLQSPQTGEMFNTDFLRSIIQSNSHLQGVVDSNPEISYLLNDPAMLRQAYQLMLNPSLMLQLQRNTDRAMSNIENHPEGFRFLRNMYSTFEESLSESASSLGSMDEEPETSPASYNSIPPSQTPNTSPLPNPWATARAPPSSVDARQPPSSESVQPQLSGFNSFANMLPQPMSGGTDRTTPFDGLNADPDAIARMLSNSSVQDMIHTALSNPQFLQQILATNPFARQLYDTNPQLFNSISDPAFIQQIANPQLIETAMQMQQAISSAMGPNANVPSVATNPTTPANVPNVAQPYPIGSSPFNAAFVNNDAQALNNMMQTMRDSGMLSRLNANNPLSQWPLPGTTNSQPPEERFRIQLVQLKDMGFFDEQANILALTATNGNVSAAVERLLSNL